MPQVYVKTTKARGETLVAICDEKLLGKKFEDKKIDLVFEVRESFYKGEKTSIADSVKFLNSATIVNLIGPDIVQAAIKAGYVNPSAVISLAGIPHAQIFKA
ncbi:MAG: DUF424 family protein [Candidatus Bathyarchaeota archaeon]